MGSTIYARRVDELGMVLAQAGGIAAPAEHRARLRVLLSGELERGRRELELPRSGTRSPVTVVFADDAGEGALAVLPVAVVLRADPDAVVERAWLLTAAAVGALADAGGEVSAMLAGSWQGFLVLAAGGGDAELAALAFEDQVRPVDRLRARALAFGPLVVDDVVDRREPIGIAHPMRVAARIALLGGTPADADSVAAHEDAVLAELDRATVGAAVRPHEDPDDARRAARRILQRLNGMGKWGGYHTEFAHLSRGFAPSDRALAGAVGEALLAAGLLQEKPSVGQRHVFLNPRRAADIHGLIDDGTIPPGLVLPRADQG